jgi:hypothetical protein
VVRRSLTARAALAIGKNGSALIARYRWKGPILLPSTNVNTGSSVSTPVWLPTGIVALPNACGYVAAPVPDRGVRQTVVDRVPLEEPSRTVKTSTARIASSPDKWPRYTVKQIWQQAYYAPFPKGVTLLVGRR